MRAIIYTVSCILLMLVILPVSKSQTTKPKTPARTAPKTSSTPAKTNGSASVTYPRRITVAAGFQATIEKPSEVIRPQNFSQGQKYPLVIFLPWTGGDATRHFSLYAGQLNRIEPFVAMITPEPGSTKDHSWQGFEAAVARYEDRILKDLDDLKKQQIIDPAKIVLVGFSLGGDTSWALAQRHPELFKGAIISGSRTSWSEKNGIARLRTHGGKFFFVMGTEESADRLAGLNSSLSLLEKNQVPYKFERTPGGHTSPPFELFASGLKYILE